jgi:WD40 repeat protein
MASYGPDGFIRVWDVATWSVRFEVPTIAHGTSHLLFSPDSTYLMASGGPDKPSHDEDIVGEIRVWDATSGKEVGRVTEQGMGIDKFTVTADGQTVFFARAWEKGAIRRIPFKSLLHDRE